jgi:hypothetical protein
MRKIGACLAIAVLASAALAPTPSPAFGLRIGPFHIGLPFIGIPRRARHRRATALHQAAGKGDLYDKASLGGTEPAQGADRALLYPDAALPGLYDEIFWPDHSPPWPFDYDAIFRGAFAKPPAGQDAQACQQTDRTARIVGRIGAEVRPRPDQSALLQKLGQALGMASGYLTKACPKDIPAQPVARLNLMQSQIQALSMALDLIRPPLEKFEQSLDAKQKARFAAMGRASTGASAGCGAAPAATDWSIDDINQSVQPNDKQRQAISDLKQAFVSTAGDLHAHCPNPLPATPLARLQAIEGRLDSSWRAALAMQVALVNFESRLSDEQKNRFETMNVAQAP